MGTSPRSRGNSVTIVHTEVEGDHPTGPRAHRVGLACGHQINQVEAGRAGIDVGRGQQGHLVGRAECADHGPRIAQVSSEATGVDTTDSGHSVVPQKRVEVAVAAPIAVATGQCAHDHPAAERAPGLVVGRGNAVVADVGVGERDDLARVRGIGDDLLITGHGGIKTYFAHRVAGGANASSLEHGAVGQYQACVWGLLLPAGHGRVPSS